MENQIFELRYALDTFYFLVCGALVMWMAAGFAMLEAGLVRAKNTTEILTKNVALFAIACIMYMVCRLRDHVSGDYFLSTDHRRRRRRRRGAATYAPSADFYFQVVFVATAMSIVSGAVAERMKLWAFLAFAVVMTGFIYPMEGSWTWGGNPVFGMYTLGDLGFLDFAGSGIVHMAGAAAALAGVLLLGPRRQVPCRRLRRSHPRRQPAPGHARYVHPVAGLVRLQRRLGAGDRQCRERQRGGRGVHEHQRRGLPVA
jgi:Amt family ammonium transporter